MGEYQTQAAYYQGPATGTPIKIVLTCYNGNPSSCAAPASPPSLPIQQTDVYTNYNSSTATTGTHVVTKYDPYGNVTSVNTYDFGGATLLSSVASYYGQTWNGSSACSGYTSGYIRNTPCYTQTTNAGSVVAATNTAYSNTGHPTTVSRLVGASWLKSSMQYGTNGAAAGVLSSFTDVNGASTSYGNFVCSGVLPTAITYPLLSTSQTWDSGCTGGVLESSTDANNSKTSYTYNDPLWRMTSSTDPLQNLTTIEYPDATHSESYLNFNTSSTVDTQTIMDGIGRPITVQKRQAQGSSSFDSVGYQYGWSATGAFMKESLPYSGSPVAWKTTQYDAVGRVQQVSDAGGGAVTYTYQGNDVLQVATSPTIQKQLQYDGLGRLTSVCEITSASGSGTCSQSTAKTGYWTQYLHDTTTLNGNVVTRITVQQNAQSGSPQKRTYLYDLVGRLVQESNPETGTTTYTYDSDATCGSYPGDRVKRVDNAGNVTCYEYDALHRVTQVSYPIGPNASTSPTKTFVYDSTTFSCPSGSNVGGRLAEAYTGSSSSKITDIAYCYSARGEVTDVYESTPNSGGYYHLTATYFANGAVNSIGGIPGETTVTYGVDGEGRPYSAAQGSTNMVSSTIYDLTNYKTTITLGLGDIDTYQYDGNTGRMTQFQFSVGATPTTFTGTMTWNPNGTLSSQTIVDNLSGQTQNCTYLHDELGRIGTPVGSSQPSVNCVNGSTTLWQQTFTYDPFGNITKSGTSSWIPGYSAANNQYVLGGTSYDGNGNLLNDTFATYGWNASNRPVTIVSGSNNLSLTYDAFDRMVERNNGSHVFQVLYGPTGYLGTMNGQTENAIKFPLPGGVVYDVYQKAFFHKDWLKSTRLSTTLSGRALSQSTAYAPFGEPYALTGSTFDFTGDPIDFLKATYDTTGGGGFEDTPNRELRVNQGRWISPDAAGLAAVDPTNPQTWNRYAYVANNPLSYVDPLGFEVCPADTGGHQFACVVAPDPGGPPIFNSIPGGLCAWIGFCRGGPGGPVEVPGTTVVVTATPPEGPAANTGPGPFQRRIVCANTFANDHSVAAALGAQDTVAGKALGGNIFGGIGELGVAVFGNGDFSSRDGAALAYGGAGLGIPIPGSHPGLNGAGGVVQDGIVKVGAQFGYNILTGGAQLSTEALEEVATGVGIAKAVFDFGVYAYGFVQCR